MDDDAIETFISCDGFREFGRDGRDSTRRVGIGADADADNSSSNGLRGPSSNGLVDRIVGVSSNGLVERELERERERMVRVGMTDVDEVAGMVVERGNVVRNDNGSRSRSTTVCVISRLCKQTLVKPSFTAGLSRGFGTQAEQKARASATTDMSARQNKEILDKVRTDESKDFTEQSNMQAFRDDAKKKINSKHMQTDQCAGPECDIDHSTQAKTAAQQNTMSGQTRNAQGQEWTAREQEKTMGQTRNQTWNKDQKQDKTMSKEDFNTWEGNTAKKEAWTKDQDKTMNQDWTQKQQTNRMQDRVMTDSNEMRGRSDQKNMNQDWAQAQQTSSRLKDRVMTDSNEMRGREDRTDQRTMKDVNNSTDMTEENLKNDLYESKGKKMTGTTTGTATTDKTQSTMRGTANMSNNNLNFSRVGADTVNDTTMRQNKSSEMDQRTQTKSDSKLYNTQSNAGIGAESLNPGKTAGNYFNDTTLKSGTASDFTKKESQDRSNRWTDTAKLADTKAKTNTTAKTEKKTESGERIDESSWGL